MHLQHADLKHHICDLESAKLHEYEHDEYDHGNDSTAGNILKVTNFRLGELGVRMKTAMVRSRSHLVDGSREKVQTDRVRNVHGQERRRDPGG